MPEFLTPYLVVEGSIVEVMDCVAQPMVAYIEERTFSYRCTPVKSHRATTMSAALEVFATYGFDVETDQFIGWLIIEKIRTKCHLEMRAVSKQYQQLACDVLLTLPGTLTYVGPTEQTMLAPHSILELMKGSAEAPSGPPPITHPIDLRILELTLNDPDLSDEQIGKDPKVSLSRGRVNEHRKRLEIMGYKVR